MIEIEVKKVVYRGWHCVQCNEIILKGDNVAQLTIGIINMRDFVICSKCIDPVYQLLKSKLDKKLWIYK